MCGQRCKQHVRGLSASVGTNQSSLSLPATCLAVQLRLCPPCRQQASKHLQIYVLTVADMPSQSAAWVHSQGRQVQTPVEDLLKPAAAHFFELTLACIDRRKGAGPCSCQVQRTPGPARMRPM